MGNYGFASCTPGRFHLACRLDLQEVEGFCVADDVCCGHERGMPFCVAAQSRERSFSLCGKGRVLDFFSFGQSSVALSSNTRTYSHLACPALARFSNYFQHTGSCKGGVGRGGWECLVGDVRCSGHHGDCV